MRKLLLWLPFYVLLSWSAQVNAAVPANDNFANSLVVTQFNLTITASNVGATKEPGEPSHAGNDGGASIWWTWVAPTSGPVKMFTFGSTLTAGGSMDTLLAVYTGSSVANLSLVSNNADQSDPFITDKWSYLTFNATAGTAYHIAVDTTLETNIQTGTIVLRIFADNDHLASRAILSGLGSRATNWNIGASKELNEKDYRPEDTPGITNFATKSTWWSWTAPAAAHAKTVKLSTGGNVSGSSFDTILTLYTSTSTNATHSTLTQIKCNNDDATLGAATSFLTFLATSNQTYYINVDGNDASGSGETVDVGEIALTLTVDNNLFAGRLALSGTNIQARGTSLRAIKETGEPVHSPNSDDRGGASVWWTWTAPFSGLATFNTSGSDFDTVLAIYTNASTAVSGSVLIVANDDDASLPFDQNSQITFLTAAGITYQIAVDGYEGAAGNIDLNLSFIPANVPPTLALIADRTLNEDAGPQVISLAGISPGGSDETNQTVTITAFSSDTALLSDPQITYASGSATGTLTFTPQPDANGVAGITVIVTDTGGTGNGGSDSVTKTFLVTVNELNDRPTLDSLAGQTVLEDSGVAELALTGISAGGGEFQTVTITATSSSTALVPHPVINYNSLDAEGALTFTPATNANGTATITVIVRDDGGTAGGAKDSVTNTFTLVVLPVNDAPSINGNTLTNFAVNEDSIQRTVNLTGIGSGAANESQSLTLNVSTSDPGLLTVGTVTYLTPATTGTLRFTPVTNNFGTATVTVVLSDTGGTADGGVDATTNTFLVTVLPVNDRPTLAALSSRTILEDAGLQTTNLSGISVGATNESNQVLTVTAVSSNPSLIPNPVVTYTNGQSTALLTFASLSNANGTATISVIVSDDGDTSGGGIAAVTNTFSVGVTAVNDPPIIDPLADLLFNENAGGQTFLLDVTGIAEGPANEVAAQSVTALTVSSSNPGLVPTPVRTFTVGSTTATITFTPATNTFGSVTISAVFTDNGGTLNGGISTSTNTFRVTVLPSANASTLTVARTNNIATLSWPATISGWVPQSSTNLASWSTLGGSPVNLNGRFTLTDTVSGPGKFYRLTKP